MLHLPVVDDSIANRLFYVTLDTNSTAIVEYKRTECSVHYYFWNGETLDSRSIVLALPSDAPSQQMKFYNHFPVLDDILLQRLAGRSTAILDVLSTSALSTHDKFGVSRLCFCRYAVQLLPIQPPPVNPDVRDRQEQDRSYPRLSALPPREYSSIFDVIFSTKWHSSSCTYACWNSNPWLSNWSTATFGELCGICAQVRNDRLTVHAIPSRGRSHILGMPVITIERQLVVITGWPRGPFVFLVSWLTGLEQLDTDQRKPSQATIGSLEARLMFIS